MGCSTHNVPSWSNVAMRSSGGTNCGLDGSVVVRMNCRIALFAAPSFHDGRGSVSASAGASTPTLPAAAARSTAEKWRRFNSIMTSRDGGPSCGEAARASHSSTNRLVAFTDYLHELVDIHQRYWIGRVLQIRKYVVRRSAWKALDVRKIDDGFVKLDHRHGDQRKNPAIIVAGITSGRRGWRSRAHTASFHSARGDPCC